MDYTLVIVKVDSRKESAVKVQNILTENGCYIRVRLGLHDIPGDSCEPSGLIILEVTGKDEEIGSFVASLNAVDEVKATKVNI